VDKNYLISNYLIIN